MKIILDTERFLSRLRQERDSLDKTEGPADEDDPKASLLFKTGRREGIDLAISLLGDFADKATAYDGFIAT